MWFRSESIVKEEEISDIRAYNRKNGIMWLAYSLVFWVSTFLGLLKMSDAGIVLFVGCMAGIPFLICSRERNPVVTAR
ncbi:MAG: hypothetical protein Q4D81_11030, partial [Eubacteriales bacterium]|nr:hypothetical protein [Eubacteriales bacterium]